MVIVYLHPISLRTSSIFLINSRNCFSSGFFVQWKTKSKSPTSVSPEGMIPEARLPFEIDGRSSASFWSSEIAWSIGGP